MQNFNIQRYHHDDHCDRHHDRHVPINPPFHQNNASHQSTIPHATMQRAASGTALTSLVAGVLACVMGLEFVTVCAFVCACVRENWRACELVCVCVRTRL